MNNGDGQLFGGRASPKCALGRSCVFIRWPSSLMHRLALYLFCCSCLLFDFACLSLISKLFLYFMLFLEIETSPLDPSLPPPPPPHSPPRLPSPFSINFFFFLYVYVFLVSRGDFFSSLALSFTSFLSVRKTIDPKK